DACLREIAIRARRAVRKSETELYRYGGEEFAALVDHPDPAVAVDVAHRIRDTLRRRPIDHATAPGGIVTVSCGVASTLHLRRPFRPDIARQMVEAADEAL